MSRSRGLRFRHGWPVNDSQSVQAEALQVGDAIEFRVYSSGWAGIDHRNTWGYVSNITEKSVVVSGNGYRHRISRARWAKHYVHRYVKDQT